MDAHAIETTLAPLPALPAPRLYVIAKLSTGINLLGSAETHGQAEALGHRAGVICTRISRAELATSGRRFFVLH